ncbi:hypothetical protein [Anaerosinus sp.]|uniref:hypothetical protein n=1 Tax=Selenobaculum sp. TaxID=3074374 RepID=UPI003AB3C2B2
MPICMICDKCGGIRLDIISMPKKGLAKVHCFDCGNDSVHIGVSFGRLELSDEQVKEVQADRAIYRL